MEPQCHIILIESECSLIQFQKAANELVFSNWKHIESSYSICDFSNSIRALSNSTGDITISIRVPFNWIRDLWDYWVWSIWRSIIIYNLLIYLYIKTLNNSALTSQQIEVWIYSVCFLFAMVCIFNRTGIFL